MTPNYLRVGTTRHCLVNLQQRYHLSPQLFPKNRLNRLFEENLRLNQTTQYMTHARTIGPIEAPASNFTKETLIHLKNQYKEQIEALKALIQKSPQLITFNQDHIKVLNNTIFKACLFSVGAGLLLGLSAGKNPALILKESDYLQKIAQEVRDFYYQLGHRSESQLDSTFVRNAIAGTFENSIAGKSEYGNLILNPNIKENIKVSKLPEDDVSILRFELNLCSKDYPWLDHAVLVTGKISAKPHQDKTIRCLMEEANLQITVNPVFHYMSLGISTQFLKDAQISANQKLKPIVGTELFSLPFSSEVEINQEGTIFLRTP